MTETLNDAQKWRFRAEEARTTAEKMKDGKSKAIMNRIADDYERLAQHAEKRMTQSGHS